LGKHGHIGEAGTVTRNIADVVPGALQPLHN
jgi:hypothetical protein